MRKQLLSVCIASSSLLGCSTQAQNTEKYEPPMVEARHKLGHHVFLRPYDYSPAQSHGLIDLSNDQNEDACTFCVLVDKTGRGHLQCPYSGPLPISVKNLMQKNQTLIQVNGKGSKELSRVEAERLWGKPMAQAKFSTFSPSSIHWEERNIFHVDLAFDSKGIVSAYRVRGIGITNPCWFKKQSIPSPKSDGERTNDYTYVESSSADP